MTVAATVRGLGVPNPRFAPTRLEDLNDQQAAKSEFMSCPPGLGPGEPRVLDGRREAVDRGPRAHSSSLDQR